MSTQLPTNDQVKSIKKTSYLITKKNRQTGEVKSLGFTTVGGISIPIELMGSTQAADQEKSDKFVVQLDGMVPQDITIDLLTTDHETIMEDLFNGYVDSVNGNGKKRYELTDKEVDARDYAWELEIMPIRNIVSGQLVSQANAFRFHLVFPAPGSAPTWVGNKDNFGTLSFSLAVMPDLDNPRAKYGYMGDLSAAETVAPTGVWATMGYPAGTMKHVPAVSLSAGGAADPQWFAYYDANAVTGELTESGGINATATTFDVAMTTVPPAGSKIRVNDEVMHVVTATNSSLTVVRACCGTTAASHSENDDIETSIGFNANVNSVAYAEFVSSAPANVIAGDALFGTGSTKKGRITWAGAGAANITCEVDAADGLTSTTSPNLVATGL